MLAARAVFVQEVRVRWRSPWIASCLPASERIVRAHRDLLDVVDRFVNVESHRSAMDAVVACLLPELQPTMRAFYAGRGGPLVALGEDRVSEYDRRLAVFLRALVDLDAGTRRAAVAAVRAGI
jgi:hypothetical protein